MAKYIQIPEDIKLKDLLTREQLEGEPYTFWKYLQGILLNDTRFGANWKMGRSAAQISDAFFEKAAGTWVELETADYELLKAVAEEPKQFDMATRQTVGGYNPLLLQQIGPFIAAVQAGETNKAPTKD